MSPLRWRVGLLLVVLVVVTVVSYFAGNSSTLTVRTNVEGLAREPSSTAPTKKESHPLNEVVANGKPVAIDGVAVARNSKPPILQNKEVVTSKSQKPASKPPTKIFKSSSCAPVVMVPAPTTLIAEKKSEHECSRGQMTHFDTVMTIRRKDLRGMALLDWIAMDPPRCERIIGYSRLGGFKKTLRGMINSIGAVTCRMLTVRLAANEEGSFEREATHAPVIITLPLSSHHSHWFSPNGTDLSPNLTVQHFNVVPSEVVSPLPPTHRYFVGEFNPAFAGHSYDYGGPQMRWILQLHPTEAEWQQVMILYPEVPAGHKSYGENFLRMIRIAYPQFIWWPIPYDNRVLLFNRNVTVVAGGFHCARLLAEVMWPRLKEALKPRHLRVHRSVAILKMNSTLSHYTHRFFSISDEDRKWLETNADLIFLPEDIPKEERMWHINTAQVVFSSSGANGNINDNLFSRQNSSASLFVEFVHPKAETFWRKKCAPEYKRRAHESIFHAACFNTTLLTRKDFLKYLQPNPMTTIQPSIPAS